MTPRPLRYVGSLFLALILFATSACIVGSACDDCDETLTCEEQGGAYRCYDNVTGKICPDLDDPECTCDCGYPCSEDADCANEDFCNSDGYCSHHACLSEADCDNEEVCAEDHECRPELPD